MSNYPFTIALAIMLACVPTLRAQTCSPEGKFVYIDGQNEDGTTKYAEDTGDSFTGSAPVEATFTANPSDYEDYSARFEWLIYQTDDTANVLIHRFDEELHFTFNNSGSFTVELRATFQNGEDIVNYFSREEGTSISVTISESVLEMPNAFSPGDDDDLNRIYKAKPTHKSIVKFHATIFNRWGQKLYSWDDINGGWDGKVNGRIVKNGVYFVNVNALGADGRKYHIRKDVNVLTKYTQSESETSTATE